MNRRDLFQRGAVAAMLGGLGVKARAARQNVYQWMGVRPLINARGTFTIISGSLMLPEVREAMTQAAQQHVHIDEIMEAAGRKLAGITKAEWGMVSCGCAAALTHATAACVAGGNPDLHVRLPNLEGFAKDEVIIPRHSRNVYDAAVRAVGVKIVEVSTPEEFDAAIGPKTAMIYILAGPNVDKSPLTTEMICARAKGVPVLVDAAAEILTIPNVHLAKGATLVAYSGGKCIRGPQTAGLLLGRKNLIEAAWMHSSPHHGFSRSMKVGKEEIAGMVTAVEMWTKRDHQGEWNEWMARLEHIARRVSAIDGVRTNIVEPEGLSNRTPTLHVRWDESKIGISGREVAQHLFNTEPRIALPTGFRQNGTETGLSVVPYQMASGDEKVVADRLHATLSKPPQSEKEMTAAPAADLSGRWDVRIDYLASSSTHVLHLTQQGNKVQGTHQGDFVSRELNGAINGNRVRFSSDYTERHGDALSFTFTGEIGGDQISGEVDMGEYLKAKFTATRHKFRTRG